MRKALFVASVFAVAHAASTLLIIRWANTAYQRWFDIGISLTLTESVGHLLALVLSFPVATWALTFHPERVSTQALVTSVVSNSVLWSVCVYFIVYWFYRKAAPNNSFNRSAS